MLQRLVFPPLDFVASASVHAFFDAAKAATAQKRHCLKLKATRFRHDCPQYSLIRRSVVALVCGLKDSRREDLADITQTGNKNDLIGNRHSFCQVAGLVYIVPTQDRQMIC